MVAGVGPHVFVDIGFHVVQDADTINAIAACANKTRKVLVKFLWALWAFKQVLVGTRPMGGVWTWPAWE